VASHAVSEKPYELAYEASVRAIEDQAAVVEGLASRAGTLLAAAAIVTSFLGGEALARSRDARRGAITVVSLTGGAIALFIAVAILTLLTLLPFRIKFSLSAASLIALTDARAATDPIPAQEAFRELALRYDRMYRSNRRQVRLLLWLFRLASLCLMGEVSLWILVLARTRL
jgi:hypothetical protein